MKDTWHCSTCIPCISSYCWKHVNTSGIITVCTGLKQGFLSNYNEPRKSSVALKIKINWCGNLDLTLQWISLEDLFSQLVKVGKAQMWWTSLMMVLLYPLMQGTAVICHSCVYTALVLCIFLSDMTVSNLLIVVTYCQAAQCFISYGCSTQHHLLNPFSKLTFTWSHFVLLLLYFVNVPHRFYW